VGKHEIEQAVDTICNQGCQYVNALLENDSVRNECSALAILCAEEQSIVLQELASVMSVYAQTGSCEI
jgi:hypothetical protein